MSWLAATAAIGAALAGGIFFVFSNTVMRALGKIPPAEGARAMQSINVVILNPWFLGLFLGTAVVAVAAAALHTGNNQVLTVIAAALYVFGCIGVTGTRNVPLNDRLAPMDADTEDAQSFWGEYLTRWTRWNHVRTAACVASSALFLAAEGIP